MARRVLLWAIGCILLVALGLAPTPAQAALDRNATGLWSVTGNTTVTQNGVIRAGGFSDFFQIFPNGCCQTLDFASAKWSTSRSLLTIRVPRSVVIHSANMTLKSRNQDKLLIVKTATDYIITANYTKTRLTNGRIAGSITFQDRKGRLRRVWILLYNCNFTAVKIPTKSSGGRAPAKPMTPPAPNPIGDAIDQAIRELGPQAGR